MEEQALQLTVENFKKPGCVFFDNEDCDKHMPHGTLPEASFRTQVIRDAIKTLRLANHEFSTLVTFQTATLTFEETMKYASNVHSTKYLARLQGNLRSAEQNEAMSYVGGNSETPVSGGSREALIASVAIVIAATMQAHEKKLTRAFCNIRPPGHHACAKKAMGFCYLNNVAIAIEHALFLNPTHRISIVDWDNHHGNGLQNLYYSRENVQYISIHADYRSSYPVGSGNPKDTGDYNNVLNISLPFDSGHDVVRTAFVNQVEPALLRFQPTLIYISCGFDAHELDHVGTLKYETKTYQMMTEFVTWHSCTSKEHPTVISVLEGGYNEQALRESSITHINVLCSQ